MALVSRWDGYCLPCGSAERPLALTWTGRRGVRAWLAGEGWHDGELRLTCACCGGVDVVGWEDEPEPVCLEADVVVDVVVEVPAPAAEAPAPAVVRVVRVLDVDAPDAVGVHQVAEVPAARRPPRAERRAAIRAGLGLPDGTRADDALDLLHLVG